jgi:hypothetical protein
MKVPFHRVPCNSSWHFLTFVAGLERGYDISRRAQLTRPADGKTLVSVHATVLAPNVSYGVHGHNNACNDTNGGRHYQEFLRDKVRVARSHLLFPAIECRIHPFGDTRLQKIGDRMNLSSNDLIAE